MKSKHLCITAFSESGPVFYSIHPLTKRGKSTFLDRWDSLILKVPIEPFDELPLVKVGVDQAFKKEIVVACCDMADRVPRCLANFRLCKSSLRLVETMGLVELTASCPR